MLLLHLGEQFFHLVIVLEALVKINAVLQLDGMVEAHRNVGIILLFIGRQQTAQEALQLHAFLTHSGELPVQIQGGALADLVV